MGFASFEFLSLFAVLFVVYYAIPPKLQKSLQWIVLLVVSGFFYYTFLSKPSDLAYIGGTIVSSYVFAVFIERLHVKQKRFLAENKTNPTLSKPEIKSYKEREKNKRLALLTTCLLLNFGLLGFIKVTGLAIIGVSFYTFRSMSYVIDLYRDKIKHQRNFLKFALYVSFFPVILQGPVTRYDELNDALFRGNRLRDNLQNASFGFQRILWGVFKKLVIADRLSVAVAELCGNPSQYGGIYALVAMLFYAVTLYCDFTGGIDITIGVGQSLGIPIVENFNSPFLSRNIFEYWRRWHMTMGRWFREYLFYPLSVCKPMLKFGGFTRKKFGGFGKRLPVYIVTLVTWFSTGIWHGVSPNYIAWGLANGIVIVISQEMSPLFKKFGDKYAFTKSFVYACFQTVRTFWLMCFIRSFDCYAGVRTTLNVHLSIVKDFEWTRFWTEGLSKIGLQKADYI
ncbi:MAG: MBOAT family protein, partial [Oscillospiraceae bacterium]|nr:MBOAT family protein [Oscillospiraceae bacterium]